MINNKNTQQNDDCCNDCGSSIKYVQQVTKHLCKGLALNEPDTIIYETYYEPVCTNCDNMTEVISKAEFANRVDRLMSKIFDDFEIEQLVLTNENGKTIVDSDLIESFREIAKTSLN